MALSAQSGRAVGRHAKILLSFWHTFHRTWRRPAKKLPKISEANPKRIMSYQNDYELDPYEPIITHGESVVDRKSVFQGHCAAIHRIEHVDIFLNKLKENKKIENAFHNMWAYRLDKRDPEAKQAGKSAFIIQDCDDDGEQAAGARLLNLLQILNVVNVMVVVTRWYGGIQLGPARFKHINNAARDSLVKGGFVNDGSTEAGTSQDKTKTEGKGKSTDYPPELLPPPSPPSSSPPTFNLATKQCVGENLSSTSLTTCAQTPVWDNKWADSTSALAKKRRSHCLPFVARFKRSY